jgi:signal transduction histidine kinase
MGVELDWSTAGLPEVSGVTPSNALSVLRILQEAITNALKHGPARQITVRGAAAPNGMVAITVENDGRPLLSDKTGHGLANMRRRAAQLRGHVQVRSLESGVQLTLLLPLSLPEVLVDPAHDHRARPDAPSAAD